MNDRPDDDSIKKVPQISPDSEMAVEVAARLRARGEWLAVAESCTGGLIAKTLTDLAGSSEWFERGLVTYSNRSKQDLLGVPVAILERHGSVSRETVEAMARGLLAHAPVDWTLAVTGIAGPTGGSAEKAVGLVWIACAGRETGVATRRFQFSGSRETVRAQAASAALQLLLERLNA